MLAINLNPVLDFLLPRVCEHCGSVLSAKEKILCGKCLSEIIPTTSDVLFKEYQKKFSDEVIINDFYSAFMFIENSPIQSLIHALKYNGKFRLGIYLGKIAAEKVQEKIKTWNADFLVPVPLFHSKKAERGFNQSFYIAKGFSTVLKIPVKQNIIKRSRYTKTQTALNFEERKKNILNAFKIKNSKYVVNKNIILVDDVITTGSTVRECGKVLKANGAKNVYALSAAIA